MIGGTSLIQHNHENTLSSLSVGNYNPLRLFSKIQSEPFVALYQHPIRIIREHDCSLGSL